MDDILEYEGLVRKITAKYNFRSDYDDLYQAGMIGLIKALQKYDSSKESSFIDYAYFWIKGEVLKTLNSENQVKISNDTYKCYQEINRTKEQLAQSFGKEPTNYEVSYVLGLSEEYINSVINAVETSISLDSSNIDDNVSLYNKISLIEKGYDVGVLDLKDAINSLEENEKELITSRYYQDKTQQETADILGISQVQASRKEKKILQKLKNKVAA